MHFFFDKKREKERKMFFVRMWFEIRSFKQMCIYLDIQLFVHWNKRVCVYIKGRWPRNVKFVLPEVVNILKDDVITLDYGLWTHDRM